MTIPDHTRLARERQRKLLIKLGLHPRLERREYRDPFLTVEQQRQELIKRGEDPDYIEVWDNA